MSRLFVFWFLLVSPLGLAQAPPEQPQGIISGVVVTDAGIPLQGAGVMLVPDISSKAKFEPRTSQTGETGKFTITGVPPGTYSLGASQNGYLPQAYGGARPGAPLGTPIIVQPSQEVSGLRIVMISPGVITGQVSSATGEPVQGIGVYAVRWSYTSELYPTLYNGVRKLEQAGIEGRTNNDGAFRIWGLSPGRYFVYAEPTRNSGPSETEAGAALPTFAPNALEVSGALAVDVFAGGTSSANIRLRQDGTYAVRGKVVGPKGPAAGAVVVLLDPAETPILGSMGGPRDAQSAMEAMRARGSRQKYAARVQTDSEGNFTLRGVPPGKHRLLATGGRNLNFGPWYTILPPTMTSGEGGSVLIEFEVRDEDLRDVEARLSPGANVSLNFRFDQPPDTARKLTAPRWSLMPEHGAALGGYSEFGQPHELSAGRYYFAFQVPRDYYVKSVRRGGQDVTGQALMIAGGTAGFDILMAPGAGTVRGSITDREGHSVAGATVSLWPVARDLSRPTGGAVTGTAGQDGSFTHYSVAPGEYYVAAFEDLPDAGLGLYPDFLARFTGQAARVKVALDGTSTANIKIIPKADIARVIESLP